MVRPVALTPMRADAARRMRRTAQVLDDDHPETVAGGHIRDAARVLEHGSTEGAKRHLDAAMEVLTPRNLYRHGITDDEGHATAKHHMHQVHRHRLAVQDIEDAQSRNDQIREALRATREQIAHTDAAAERAPSPPAHPGGEGAPPPPPAASAQPTPAKQVAAPPAGTAGRQQAPPPRKSGPPPPARRRAAAPQPAGARLSNPVELKGGSTAWMTERRGKGGKWIGPGGALMDVLAAEGTKIRKAPKSRPNPAEASLQSIFSGKGSAEAFASWFGGAKLKDPKAERAALKKSQRVVYDKLRKRNRSHASALHVARTFTPEMLRAAAFAGTPGGMLLAFSPDEPRGPGGEWMRAGDRALRIMHGRTVTARTQGGSTVRGTYHHDLGTVRPGPGGRPVRVAQVLNTAPSAGWADAAGRLRTQTGRGPLSRLAGRLAGERTVTAANLTNAASKLDAWPRAATTPGISGSSTREDLLAAITARTARGRLVTGPRSTGGTARARTTTSRSASPATTGTTGPATELASATATPGSPSHRSPASGTAGLKDRRRWPASSASPSGQSRRSARAGTGPGSLDLSARTAMLERTPAPRGRPGGPGLYDVKGMGHTAYFQQVVKALIEKRGMPPDKAYRIAWGALRKWRRGGGHVHPEVRAAASGALAGEAARGAAARAAHGHSNTVAWDVAGMLVELACEPIELFNPYHAPPGAGGGQFVSKGGAGAAQQKPPPAQQKQQAAKAQAADRKGDRAQRQALIRKIAGLRQQIAALQAQLPKPKGARKAGAKKAAAASPAAAAAAAKRATAAKSKSPTPAKKGVRKMSPATIRAKIAALQATMRADIAQLRAIH